MKELDFHKMRYMAGKIDRREFIGRAIALGVTAGAASVIASDACLPPARKRAATCAPG